MDKITKTDIENAFSGYIAARRRIGLDVREYSIITGSKMYGQSFKIVQAMHGGGQSVVMHLGFTKRDAYNHIVTMTYAYNEVHTERAYGI